MSIFTRVLDKVGEKGGALWAGFREVMSKITTGNEVTDATIAAAGIGAIYEVYQGDYDKVYNEAKLAVQGKALEVFAQWLEDATGVRPVTYDEPGLKDWAGRVVALKINEQLGTSIASAYPANNVIEAIKGEVENSIVDGTGMVGKYRVVPEKRAVAIRTTIAKVQNTAMLIKMRGKMPKLPMTKESFSHALRQAKYRGKLNWYPYTGITPQMDAVIARLEAAIAAEKAG